MAFVLTKSFCLESLICLIKNAVEQISQFSSRLVQFVCFVPLVMQAFVGELFACAVEKISKFDCFAPLVMKTCFIVHMLI